MSLLLNMFVLRDNEAMDYIIGRSTSKHSAADHDLAKG